MTFEATYLGSNGWLIKFKTTNLIIDPWLKGDLIFPHHENEIAQSRCANDSKVFANYWLHNAFITMSNEKMSKSQGNILKIKDFRNIIKNELEKNENNLEKSFFSIFITTFTTIFIAELGDKTQIATLMLSAESGRPIVVFLGSSLALISSSIVGVLIGKWVSKKISPSKFALSTGTLMILISIFLAYETFKNYL